MTAQTAFIFDMDDTLYDRGQPFADTCCEVFGKRFSIDYRKLYLARCQYGDEVFDAAQRGEISMEDMYIYRLTRALSDFGKAVSREEILHFEERYQYYQQHIHLYPGMREILKDLQSRRIPTGLITNGASAHQRNKLQALHLDPLIPSDRWCISGEIGINKPDPGIIRAAEKKLNLTPQTTWYIGDNYANDIVGAKCAGWHAIWFNQESAAVPDCTPECVMASDTDYRPDYIVTSIGGLARLLKVIASS